MTRNFNTSIWYQVIKKISDVRVMEARYSTHPSESRGFAQVEQNAELNGKP